MQNLIKKRRVIAPGETPRYVYYWEDYPVQKINNMWLDTGGRSERIYVVQTNEKIVQRCMLMCSDPGDLVLDITCGSGTTAVVAEQFGRRWITCDTSRVSVVIAKQRIMSELYDYYELAHPHEGVDSGFKYKTVPHVTLRSVANNDVASDETLYDQPITDSKKARITGPFTVEAVPAPVVQAIS